MEAEIKQFVEQVNYDFQRGLISFEQRKYIFLTLGLDEYGNKL